MKNKNTKQMIEERMKTLKSVGHFRTPDEVEEFFEKTLNEIAQAAKAEGAAEQRERIVERFKTLRGPYNPGVRIFMTTAIEIINKSP